MAAAPPNNESPPIRPTRCFSRKQVHGAIDDLEILGVAKGQVPKFDFGADQWQKGIEKNMFGYAKKAL